MATDLTDLPTRTTKDLETDCTDCPATRGFLCMSLRAPKSQLEAGTAPRLRSTHPGRTKARKALEDRTQPGRHEPPPDTQ